ncbi:MAG: bifunctional riboflavin kinase/FAD synthetase [Bacteroidia bacterium]|nr:bifunctional riboflavin kinase/FAD synthetase [Bacteroidia bacterium]
MKVYRSLEELPQINNAIVTQGTFDGVHAAHKVILNRLKQIAKERNGETVVITFDPHPRMVLFPHDHGLKLLNTLDEKINYLGNEGIDHLVIIPFTKEFSRLTSMQFIRDIMVNKIGTKVLVIGYNHRFGKNREGAFEHLKEYSNLYGFDVEEIPEQDIDEISISSTQIRNALIAGDVKQAAKYLGKNYTILGKVIQGKQLGRTIGFPTANIKVADVNKLIPADGVYAVKVFINNRTILGMLNCGVRPTVDGLTHAVEVHLFDFNEDLYNTTLSVAFVDKLRNEIKFENLQALTNQLENDKLHALAILSTTHNDN